MYRAPSLACACAIAARNAVDSSPSLCAESSRQAGSEACSAEQCSTHGPKAVDVHDAVYMLNPSGDLAATQATFQEFFQQQPGWQVCPWKFLGMLPAAIVFEPLQLPLDLAGQPDILFLMHGIEGMGRIHPARFSRQTPRPQPSVQEIKELWNIGQGTVGAPGLPAAELAAALTQRQVFVYCGHGGGQQHLPGRALRRLPRCAASLLMGCSSGRLTRTGTYAPSGPVLAYLLAGALPHDDRQLWECANKAARSCLCLLQPHILPELFAFIFLLKFWAVREPDRSNSFQGCKTMLQWSSGLVVMMISVAHIQMFSAALQVCDGGKMWCLCVMLAANRAELAHGQVVPRLWPTFGTSQIAT